jgi:hypothetical protein
MARYRGSLMSFARGADESWSDRILRHATPLGRTTAYAAAVLVAAPCIYHVARGSDAYLGLLEDESKLG